MNNYILNRISYPSLLVKLTTVLHYQGKLINTKINIHIDLLVLKKQILSTKWENTKTMGNRHYFR